MDSIRESNESKRLRNEAYELWQIRSNINLRDFDTNFYEQTSERIFTNLVT